MDLGIQVHFDRNRMRYDVAIIGGGIAGLSLSIDLKKKGYNIVVIEKGNYPRHKVCGEYISMESHNYLQNLCPKLNVLDLPRINNFKLSSTGSSTFTTTLEQGGFGISRYLLEDLLFKEAKQKGVRFLLNCKARNITIDPSRCNYNIQTDSEIINCGLLCNSTGRRSNLAANENDHSETNYIGVKYHLKAERDPSTIEIHNFPGGYCGISNIEENKSCLCYIVNSKNLNSVDNSIPELEKTFLFKNKNLKKIFSESEFIFTEPLVISGIDFQIRKPVTENFFFLGDSAGSIAPITGNGMSIGLRSASFLSKTIEKYYSGGISRQHLTNIYYGFWQEEFSSRIESSRYIQKLSENPLLTKTAIGLFNFFPSLAKKVIQQTHGCPF